MFIRFLVLLRNVQLFNIQLLKLSALCALTLLGACRGVDTYDGSSDGRGELSVDIAADSLDGFNVVNLAVTGLQIKPTAAATPIDINFESAIIVDLLSLEAGESEQLLDEHLLEIGEYEWSRLVIDESLSNVEINGSVYALSVRPGFESGLQSDINFEVKEDSELAFTISIDLGRSITEEIGASPVAYEFLPALRLVETDRAATVSGTVATALVEDIDCDNNGFNRQEGNVVYVFEGAGAAIQDIQTNAGDPIATVEVVQDISSLTYEYAVGFLAAGTYSLVFSCDGSIDAIEDNNFVSMEFSDVVEVTLTSAGMETVDFE